MLRKTAISLAVAGILSAAQAHALGLGDIRVKSALNEPLDAEIRVDDARGLSPLQIRPSMADVDEFALAGVSKSKFLSDIKFSVSLNRDGTGVVRMKSSMPVQEPFLNFLVEVNWPSGRLVREYTVLLDPPVFDPTPASQARQPVLPAASGNAAPARGVARGSAKQPDRIYVDATDTLWALALKHRPSRDVSSQQMMIALLKKNPDAFLNNNVNLLRRGAELKLPTREEARAMTTKAAIAEIARQTAAWKTGRQVRIQPAAKAAPVDVSKKVTAPVQAPVKPQATPEKTDQLKIVSAPSQAEQKSDGTVSDQKVNSQELDKLNKRNEELEQQLAATLENVDRIERANSEMNDRLDAVQQQLDALQRMLELKDQQLAALQSELDEAKAQIPPPAPPEEPKKDLLETLLSSPIYWGSAIGGMLLALGGAVFMFLRRRKNANEEEEVLEPVGGSLVQVPDSLDAPDEEEAEQEEEQSEERSEEQEEESLNALDEMSDMDEMSDLDLDMDMDLDHIDEDLMTGVETSEPAADPLADEIDDDEFDLGIDDDLGGLDLDVDQPADAPVADDLDAIMGSDQQMEDELDSLLEADPMEALDEDIPLIEEAVEEEAVDTEAELDTEVEAELTPEPELAADEDDLLDGLDIDQLLTESEPESVEDAAAEIEPAAEALDADADDIDSLLDSVAEELDLAGSEPEVEPDITESLPDVDQIDELLDSAAESADLPDATEEEIAELLDSQQSSAEADALDGSLEPEVEDLSSDDIDDLFATASAEADEATEAMADIVADELSAEDPAVDPLAELDALDSAVDDVLDGALEDDLMAGLDDLDSLIDETGAVTEEAAAEMDSEGVDDLAAMSDFDAVEDADNQQDDMSEAEVVSAVDEIEELSAELDDLEALSAEVEDLPQESEGDVADDALDEDLVQLNNELDDLFESDEVEPVTAEVSGDLAEDLLSEITEEAEQELAAELDIDGLVDDVEPEEEVDAPEQSFGVADDLTETVDLSDDADALLDELMAGSDVSELGDDASLPELDDLADSQFDEMLSGTEPAADALDAAEAELDALMGAAQDSVEDREAMSPAQRAEEDMADLIAADLGDMFAEEDPLTTPDTQADISGLDEMLQELESDVEDIFEGDGADEFGEDVLAEVELDANDLDSDLDDMLASLEQDIASEGGDDLASLEAGQPLQSASEGQNLEAQIDSELDELLSSVDEDIEMDEMDALSEEPDLTNELNLLDGADEVETKLDLARAYIEMDDLAGASDILNEVKQEGSDKQRQEAEKLLRGMPA